MMQTLGELVRSATQRSAAELLVGRSRRWSAHEVGDDVAHLAGALDRAGVGAGQAVAVVRAKTAESLLAMWAVQWAGAVAVPLDPATPPDQLARILDAAGVRAVLTDRRGAGRLPPGLPSIVVEESLAEPDRTSRPPTPRAATDDAYVIHTSGSTGVPKGIVHTHAGAMAYAHAVVETYGLGPADRIGGMSPLHFDMSTLELYVAPLAGAAVVVMDDALMRFPASVTARSAEEHVTVWYTVPFFLQQVVDRGALEERDLSDLRWLLYGGEPYPPAALAALARRLPAHLWVGNVYGPAEVNQCTVWNCRGHELDPELPDVPIGVPWAAARVAIVDEAGRPVAPGELGELLVEADTAMRAYLGAPELTAERLRPRPELGPGRWYSTGDLARFDERGLLRYAGRADHQVKVRGVRLELDGIEAVLGGAPGVVHAVAGPDADRSAILAAVVPGPGFDHAAVLEWVRSRLAPLAVPSRLVQYPAFPRTATGKIDRRQVRSELTRCDHS